MHVITETVTTIHLVKIIFDIISGCRTKFPLYIAQEHYKEKIFEKIFLTLILSLISMKYFIKRNT